MAKSEEKIVWEQDPLNPARPGLRKAWAVGWKDQYGGQRFAYRYTKAEGLKKYKEVVAKGLTVNKTQITYLGSLSYFSI